MYVLWHLVDVSGDLHYSNPNPKKVEAPGFVTRPKPRTSSTMRQQSGLQLLDTSRCCVLCCFSLTQYVSIHSQFCELGTLGEFAGLYDFLGAACFTTASSAKVLICRLFTGPQVGEYSIYGEFAIEFLRAICGGFDKPNDDVENEACTRDCAMK